MNSLDFDKKEVAIFGGGCFWCTEAVFKMLRGVSSVLPGYAGGNVPNPTDEDIYGGSTGHAEVIKIEYDPTKVDYRDLLTVFFGGHDPTTVNRQGNDVGTQYRSVIFYTTPDHKRVAEDFIKEINQSSSEGKKVVTELAPVIVSDDSLDSENVAVTQRFYPAENYHQNYFARNGGNAYCELVINPKLEKVKQKYAALLDKIYAAK